MGWMCLQKINLMMYCPYFALLDTIWFDFLPSPKVLENQIPQKRKQGRMSFVEVHFDRLDIPSSLAAAGKSMAAKNKIAQ